MRATFSSHTYTHARTPVTPAHTYTHVHMYRKCYLHVSWQGPRTVAQRSECPEYFGKETLLMHMLHTAARL